MSEPTPISIYPDNAAQRQQIVSQARKHDESISEYCLMAIEQRIAREAESERLDDLDLHAELDDLKTGLTADIEAAMAVDTRQERFYEVALWSLLGNDFSSEERREAMQDAPDKLEHVLEMLAAEEEADD